MAADKEVGPRKVGSGSNVDVQRSKNTSSGWRWTLRSARILSEDGRKAALYELLYSNDLILMAETMEELEAQFICWKAARGQ